MIIHPTQLGLQLFYYPKYWYICQMINNNWGVRSYWVYPSLTEWIWMVNMGYNPIKHSFGAYKTWGETSKMLCWNTLFFFRGVGMHEYNIKWVNNSNSLCICGSKSLTLTGPDPWPQRPLWRLKACVISDVFIAAGKLTPDLCLQFFNSSFCWWTFAIF